MKRHVCVIGVLVGIAAIFVLSAGIWLGGHQSNLPSLLRGRFFESRRSETVTEQAINILHLPGPFSRWRRAAEDMRERVLEQFLGRGRSDPEPAHRRGAGDGLPADEPLT